MSRQIAAIARPGLALAAAAAAVGLLSALSHTSTAAAGVLAPGESSRVLPADYTEPRGVLVAESSHEFTLSPGLVDGAASAGLEGAITGTLFSSVLRDPLDGGLTFIYNARFDLDGSADAMPGDPRLTVGRFDGFSTNVSGALQPPDAADVARSADGADISITGAAGFPILVVATDATDFDAFGAARFFAADALGSASAARAFEEARIGGVFEPRSAPNAVPLPPAAYTALGAAAGCALIGFIRKLGGVHGT